MSVEELKAVVDNASTEDRVLLAAYLRIKLEGGPGSLGVSLSQARARMAAGQSVSLEKAIELHEAMKKPGA
jgi:hypothetical protein